MEPIARGQPRADLPGTDPIGDVVRMRQVSVQSPAELDGKTIAVGSLGSTNALETRYLLKEKYQLDVDLLKGDVKFVEMPENQIPTAIQSGTVDAGVAYLGLAYQLQQDDSLRVLAPVTEEVKKLNRTESLNAALRSTRQLSSRKQMG